ncbi:sulfur carrier protein [Shimia isoporae]|uniref:Sulfur carrier protein n=1 Tax=Shimia isoporae TaxID=647720 RepID=A0A4R1N228_9RHOB|nr:sulfur carrier protein ThiS [Shimia isoporae]TCL00339.1 sulfur carrier protein [Shimia isoporae]
MKILLNGTPRETTAKTLDVLLAECGYSGRVATAINEDFVPAAARCKTDLHDGDRIEVVAPMQGG